MTTQHKFLLYYSLILLFLSTTTTLISPSLGDLGKCNPSDYNALMNIKKPVHPPNSDLLSWVQNTDCCHWIGVTCDNKTNRVNELNIFGGEASGTISSSLGDLLYLESLVFSRFSNITGPIPQSITKLKHLKKLDLSDMSLSGPIPNFLNQLTTLTYLDLSYNQFTGPIPKSLGVLEFGQIDLSRNKLVWDASMLFNPNHGRTTHIDFSRNQLEFDLTNVKFPKNINWLDISNNEIFGGIPEEIKALDLTELDVSYNYLCGKIPYGGKMQSFKASSFSHNRCLCGPPMTAC